MYDWLIVILVGLAGFAEAPRWFILLGAFGLTIEGWWGRLGLLRHSPRAISAKKTAYFVVGAISNLGLAALGYLAGHLVRGLSKSEERRVGKAWRCRGRRVRLSTRA